jgi:hypothetical protein
MLLRRQVPRLPAASQSRHIPCHVPSHRCARCSVFENSGLIGPTRAEEMSPSEDRRLNKSRMSLFLLMLFMLPANDLDNESLERPVFLIRPRAIEGDS